jgi:hypothetical protein
MTGSQFSFRAADAATAALSSLEGFSLGTLGSQKIVQKDLLLHRTLAIV